MNPRKNGIGVGTVAKRKIAIQSLEIDGGSVARRCKKAFQFRTEKQPVILWPIIERLDAEAIANQNEPLGARVPKRDGKHAAQMLNKIQSVLFVEVDNHLCIAMGRKAMAFCFERRAKFEEIVNLAVERDPD